MFSPHASNLCWAKVDSMSLINIFLVQGTALCPEEYEDGQNIKVT